ncbi:NBR1-Ig-like domain-containing protein [Rhodococcoides corynebacterioides]|uniref:NBR1-Ig-like domain-containing protein n=1 Tax=Rhodococcoides corynebacterioides TaxID=53972 RepID=UPI003F821F82
MNAARSGRPKEPRLHLTSRQRFGHQLYLLRRAKGCATQRQAAQLLDCSQPTISNAERGLTVPSERVVVEWDRTLDADGLLHALYEDVVADDREKQLHQTSAASRGNAAADQPIRPIPGDASEFVCDVTIPDGTLMTPLQKFTKIWRVRNAGEVPWSDRYLQRQGSTGSVGQVHSPRATPVPDTDPGELVDLTVDCRAHVLEGSSIAYFKFADAKGHLFFPDRYGAGVVLEIRVHGTLDAYKNL